MYRNSLRFNPKTDEPVGSGGGLPPDGDDVIIPFQGDGVSPTLLFCVFSDCSSLFITTMKIHFGKPGPTCLIGG